MLGLSPRYSFDTFIVGASNQFAHAASRAVAEAPSRSYNPLFIYGGVGLGKTHLANAIGHATLDGNPDARVAYVSAEVFMTQLITAIRYDRILEFRERYQGVDVLLVDDIQFIVGKGAPRRVFHTFNAARRTKAIVLSSDCPPHQINDIERSIRFEWASLPTSSRGSRDENRHSQAESRG
jgi:chromosomal replication initiator protein